MPSTFDKVKAAIEADLESSRRHWTEVRDASDARRADPTRSPRERARAEREYAVACERLLLLAAGERVRAGF